ncbi:phage protein NinX family protein [Proteus vulgaris]|uniref:phage protein NinX family protein n=1 Tax=Proteus vulgaris TaxID=585 RepID=UPI0034D624E2
MNKYTELSDFEINELVSFNLGYVHTKSFDPCNNPSDAMPIIIDNLISLMADMSEDGGATWWCASDISNGITSRYKSNPLRAAMEIFLMIKDAENEKV